MDMAGNDGVTERLGRVDSTVNGRGPSWRGRKLCEMGFVKILVNGRVSPVLLPLSKTLLIGPPC